MCKWAGLLLAGALLGCGAKTETGFKPRKLGDGMSLQRGYYAAPFSPESRIAEQERMQDMKDRRPDLR